ncbi:MAG: hypothetical protein ACE5NM_11305 [Sedimentisphaerales bacterium]
MPAGKRKQTSAMLYTLVTFVGLFIIAATLAVIFYVKFEEQRRIANQSQRDLAEMVTEAEWRNRGKIIGAKKTNETYLGKMVDYLDKTVSSILGPLGQLKDTSAEVKVNTADKKIIDVLNLVREHINLENPDPNRTGLIPVVEKLQAQLDRTVSERATIQEQLNELQQHFDDAMIATREKEKQLEADKEKYHQEVIDITQKHEGLKALMAKKAEDREKILMAQLEEARANLKELNDELLKTQAELKMTQDRMKHALDQLQQIKPSPDREVAAYQPDGKIILIDEAAQIVHLNIGTDDHVYRGLTFSVYDRNAHIPKDGQGKAEVEVFGVSKNISAARIIHSQKKNPIALDDIVANLVWDRDKTNVFVVAGEFDLNGDGIIDRHAIDKIIALIEKWGGKVANTITVDTDFLVLGKPPQVPPKPTFEDLEVDPMANEKYEAALQRFNYYKEVQSQAQALWVPIFQYERFLYFIGYKAQMNKPGAF